MIFDTFSFVLIVKSLYDTHPPKCGKANYLSQHYVEAAIHICFSK